MSHVVGVAGPSGCGKSSLVRQLSQDLAPCSALFFDDYPVQGPSDLEEWLAERPFDFGVWRVPELARHLELLRGGTSVIAAAAAPSTGFARAVGERIEPTPTVVVEEPYGRLRPETREMIDFVVALELPLELALARRLLRQVAYARGTASERAYLEDAEGFLRFYLAGGAEAYASQMAQVSSTADLVLDARLGVAELSARVAAVLPIR